MSEALLHRIYVVLLGIASSQKEIGDWRRLVRSEGVHAWCFPVQTLTYFDYAVPCGLKTFG